MEEAAITTGPNVWGGCRREGEWSGTTVPQTVEGKMGGGKVVQGVREEEVCADHELVLSEWQDYEALLCAKCQETFERGGFSPTSLCSWRCGIHDVDVCLRCIPVVMEA